MAFPVHPTIPLPAAPIFLIPRRVRSARIGAIATTARQKSPPNLIFQRDALERLRAAGASCSTYYTYANGVTYAIAVWGENLQETMVAAAVSTFGVLQTQVANRANRCSSDGKRDLPDVSLFASNLFWSHAILFCMSDKAEGGAPCDYSNGTDTLFNSAGGTSFTTPQFASIQALINQKAGGP